jgi:outer membrane lipoprotein
MVLAMVGCAQSPVVDQDVEVAAVGPAHVLAEEGHEGERVVWGGRIVAIENLSEATELTIVSYPLDRGDRPRLRSEPGVRFILVESGFLEPVQYAPGRYVTVLGTVDGLAERAVGQSLRDHPVLLAERIHLWPADPAEWQARSRISVGIGVRF